MHHIISSTSLLWISCATFVLTLAEDGVCQTDLSHPEAPVRQIAPIIGVSNDQLDSLVALGHKVLTLAPPAIETCLASYQSGSIIDILPNVIEKCLKVATLPQAPIFEELTAAFDVAAFDANFLYAVNYAIGISSSQFTDSCKPITQDLLPCLLTAVPFIMESLQAHSNGCCDVFFNDAETKLGKSLSDMLLSLLPELVNVLCSVRTPGFNDEASQTCAYTFVQTALGENPIHALTLFQISEENACPAYQGEAFTTGSSDQVVTLGNATAGITYDSCAIPVDTLVSDLATFPFFQTDAVWSKLFAKDQMLSGSEVVPLLPAMIMDMAYGGVVGGLLSQMTLHLPSGFSDACAFVSTLVLATSTPSSVSPSQDDGGNQDPDAQDNTKKDDVKPTPNAALCGLTWTVGQAGLSLVMITMLLL